ncbi:hypothetical protein HUX57_11295 [Arcobacter butzleri]|uniref:hypothetical protein n=1 Tax=Aliarcobacter butzleri TaxID=28197 RepID=UPI00158753C8|nr:hypothetical protein [Aliarcobacter butzleri]NUW27241.1 hypothetical protein [Aliarcobacter butzleri]
MNLSKDIEHFILYDRTNIHKEIKKLTNNLGINKKIASLVSIQDDVDYFYLSSFDVFASPKSFIEQFEINKEKRLELRCVIKGKKEYIKSFGLIKDVNKDILNDLCQLLTLFKVSKKVSELSYYASKYFKFKKI